MTSRKDPTRRPFRQLSLERLEPRLVLDASMLKISEFMASNDKTLFDAEGDSSDWIEIYNSGVDQVDLSGMYLTDKDDDLTKWAFPAATSLDAGELLVVFASKKDEILAGGEIHTNFKLSSGGEFLALVNTDGVAILDQYAPEFPSQLEDISYGRAMEITGPVTTLLATGAQAKALVPTNGGLGSAWHPPGFNDSSWPISGATGLGYENNPGDPINYTAEIQTTVPSGVSSVYVRLPFNLASTGDLGRLTLRMRYDDGFVAYLNGQKVAESNAPGTPTWDSLATALHDDDLSEQFEEFDISPSISALQMGQNVLAIHALNVNTTSSDFLISPELLVESFSLVSPEQVGFFSLATPGLPNGDALQGFVAETEFSVDRGFYTDPFDLVITTPTAGASIIYTTDGSVPTFDANFNVTNGTLFIGAIHTDSTSNIRAVAFKANFGPSTVHTHTYVFLDDVLQQTAASQEAALEQGLPSIAGEGVDFGLDPDIINSFPTQVIKDSLLSVPTISLTMENGDFLGTNGIYTHSTSTGPLSERAVSVELINPDGSSGFHINAGIRIQGAASRSLAEKYSFRLAFRGKYGPTDLINPLFGTGVDKFDTIVLRSVFNDGYGWRGDDNNLREQLYVRDLWFRESQLAMGQPAARGNWAHLYVNGQYWGLYHPSERPDADFAQETLGGDNDDYDTINHGGVIDDASSNDPSNNVSANAVYNTAISLANAVNSASGTTAKNSAFQKLQGNLADGTNDPNHEDYLNVENYIDYMIVNLFGGNDDWPSRNWFTNRLRGPESEGFRFYAWDSEISLSLSTRTNVFEDYTGVSGGAAQFYSILRNHEEFNVQFGDRIHQHLFNDGALAGDNPATRFESLAVTIRSAIVGESARWGDQHFSDNPLTQAEWDAELNSMLTNYFVQRPAIALSQFRSAGLYPETEAPEFLMDGVRQHGGAIVSGASLGFENPGGQGIIYYTTDGNDPRLVGGAVNPVATLYAGSFPLNESTTVKARILLSPGVWSAVNEATFVAPQADFDSDGDVDGSDFLAWQRGFGITSGAMPSDGDANGNGTVDTVDLAEWQDQFGTASATVAAVTSTIPTALDDQSLALSQLSFDLGLLGSSGFVPQADNSTVEVDRVFSEPMVPVILQQASLDSESLLRETAVESTNDERSDEYATDELFAMLEEDALTTTF